MTFIDRYSRQVLFPGIGAEGQRKLAYARVLDAHRYIYKCLAEHDAPGAMTWMRKHMDDFRRAYELTGLSFDASLDAVTLGVIAGSSPAAHPRRHTPGRAKQG